MRAQLHFPPLDLVWTREAWPTERLSTRVSGAEQEYSLSKFKVKHDKAWSPNEWTSRYVLGIAAALRFLRSQILCKLYKTSFG